MKRSSNPTDRSAINEAVAAIKLDTIVGHIEWSGKPVKNVAKTPLVGGQWRLAKSGGPFKYDLVITSNSMAPQVPAAGKMQPLT